MSQAEECEFLHPNPHEWLCTIHDRLIVAGTSEPVFCGEYQAHPQPGEDGYDNSDGNGYDDEGNKMTRRLRG